MKYNENSRVILPAILHLTQLGYDYVFLKKCCVDEETNIFTGIFKSSISTTNHLIYG